MSNKTAARSRRPPPARPSGERPLTDAERSFTEQRWREALLAQREAQRTAQLWEETVKMLTGGDPTLGVNTRTWEVVTAPNETVTPSTEENPG